MHRDELELPAPCGADWAEMPPSADRRTRFCEHCRHDLVDLTRITESEAVAMFADVAAKGAPDPCVNVLYRRDGAIVFADTPDVPLAALRRRITRSAAALLVAAACAPTRESTNCPQGDYDGEHHECLADDNVDGEVLTPDGETSVRGRARPAALFASREMPRRLRHDAGADADVDIASRRAAALRDDLVRNLRRRLWDLDPSRDTRAREDVAGFTISFARDVSYHPSATCPPGTKCGVTQRFDSRRALLLRVECWTGPWTGTAVVTPIEVGPLRLFIDIDAADPRDAEALRMLIEATLERHRNPHEGPRPPQELAR